MSDELIGQYTFRVYFEFLQHGSNIAGTSKRTKPQQYDISQIWFTMRPNFKTSQLFFIFL